MNKIWLASFDIGIKNFAFYIEEIDQDILLDIPKHKKYIIGGILNNDYMKSLNSVYLQGKNILHKNIDITWECNKDKYIDPRLYLNLTEVLNSYSDYFNKCSCFVIEQQMSFIRGRNIKINTRALKIGQHVYSYFIIKYGGLKPVIEFEAFHKTQVFGMKKLKDKERKKWAVEMCKKIFEERNDTKSLENMNKYKKQDDLSDVVIQLQSFKYLCYVEKIY